MIPFRKFASEAPCGFVGRVMSSRLEVDFGTRAPKRELLRKAARRRLVWRVLSRRLGQDYKKAPTFKAS